MIARVLTAVGFLIAIVGLSLKVLMPEFEYSIVLVMLGFFLGALSAAFAIFNLKYPGKGSVGMRVASAGFSICVFAVLITQLFGLPEFEKPAFNIGVFVIVIGCVLTMLSVPNK
jgi:peptidoglycan/LPS O-acetylase OafA/YrhL